MSLGQPLVSLRTGLPVLARPIFVGGVSRSGTTVVGKHLLGRHPEIGCTVPAEMWFLTNTGGLCDVADSAESVRVRARLRANAWRRGHLSSRAAFRARMEGFWYRRDWWKDGRSKGLFESVDEEQLARALDDFEDAFFAEPRIAARRLAADIIDPSVRSRGKRRWVDTAPGSVRRSDSLFRLFPDLSLVNMIRDGRDVAASIVARPWGTDDYARALEHWFTNMRAGHRAMSRLPQDRVLTIQLEQLVGGDREYEYGRLLSFLGIEDDPGTRRFFDRKMSTSAGNVGRWRAGMTRTGQQRVDDRYGAMLADLDAEGIQRPI